MDAPPLTFIVGTGRCGTVTLANVLNASSKCVAMHEGEIRSGMTPKERVLPHMCLQNVAAYLYPAQAVELLTAFRSAQIARQRELPHLIDIAYYYAPFVAAIREVFPLSRLVIVVRDGRDVVRSLYTAEVPDPMPAGYVDERPFTPRERFGHAGRLRPHEDAPEGRAWDSYSPFQKNCWLWAETNRIILDGAADWEHDRVRLVRFEDLVKGYMSWKPLLEFLDIDDIGAETVEAILARKLNCRKKTVLPHPGAWSDALLSQFKTIAGFMMRRLDYFAHAERGVAVADASSC